MKPAIPIDIELVRSRYDYDPSTGILTSKRTGKPITTTVGKGYLSCRINKRQVAGHRVIWAIHYGEDPGDMIVDHIDMDRSNNRISNLRLVNNADNIFNNRFLCIQRVGKRWRARVTRGKAVCLGTYDCPLIAGLVVADYKKPPDRGVRLTE